MAFNWDEGRKGDPLNKLIASLALAASVSTASFAADRTETIKVSGWHCADCAAKTETALKDVNGVTAVKADKTKKVVRVTYDDRKVKRADLDKAIADSGYAAEQ
jgi:mercuric transport protein